MPPPAAASLLEGEAGGEVLAAAGESTLAAPKAFPGHPSAGLAPRH